MLATDHALIVSHGRSVGIRRRSKPSSVGVGQLRGLITACPFEITSANSIMSSMGTIYIAATSNKAFASELKTSSRGSKYFTDVIDRFALGDVPSRRHATSSGQAATSVDTAIGYRPVGSAQV